MRKASNSSALAHSGLWCYQPSASYLLDENSAKHKPINTYQGTHQIKYSAEVGRNRCFQSTVELREQVGCFLHHAAPSKGEGMRDEAVLGPGSPSLALQSSDPAG